MPLRHTFRRRALSNGLAEERPCRTDLLFSHTPQPAAPLPSFSTGLSGAKRGGSTHQALNSNHHRHHHHGHRDDNYVLESSPADAQEDDTVNEIYASIWRQSLFDDEHLTPPSSPSRFIFSQGVATSARSGIGKIRQGSLKKCFTSSTFPTNVVSTLLRWRGKREKKTSNTLGSTSFLDLSTSQEELPLPSTGPRRAFSSPFMTPPRRREASGSNTTATISPLTYPSTLSSASSSLLYSPDSLPASCFAASESSLPRPCATGSSSSGDGTLPPLSSSSLLVDSYSHSPLEATRSFERLRSSLAWKDSRPSASKRAHPPSTSNRCRNRAGLPPLSPPPTEQLPPIPVATHHGLPQSSDSLQPAFLQWEQELKDLSLTLRDRPAQRRVNKAIKRSLDLDHSTPSTVTPSVLTPRVEAFEFDLDDGPSSSTAMPLPRLSPVPVQSSASTAAPAQPTTADSSFSQAVDAFPSPPLRCRSSSGGPELVGCSSPRYYSADSDIDPVSHFSISSSSESIGRLTSLSSHRCRHIDSIASSSQGTTAQTQSLYTLACDRSSDNHS